LATLLVGCGSSQSTVPRPVPPSTAATLPPSAEIVPVDLEAGKKALGEFVVFPACGIKVRQPLDFDKAEGFDGFQVEDTQTSILAMSMKAPFSKMSEGFTAEVFKSRGWTMHSREDANVDDLPGFLIHFEQPLGFQKFLKWSLVFGDETKTTMVTGTCPDHERREMAPRLKAAVLSTRLESGTPFDPERDLPFRLKASPKLKFTPSMSKALSYSKDGVFPGKSRNDPAFFVTTGTGAPGGMTLPRMAKYAEQMLHQTGKFKQLSVKSSRAVTIDGLDGVELTAAGDDSKSGDAMTIHQTILFDGESHFVLMGIVGTESKDEYLPEFQSMASSFKRKSP
jgi:hypothetical protein